MVLQICLPIDSQLICALPYQAPSPHTALLGIRIRNFNIKIPFGAAHRNVSEVHCTLHSACTPQLEHVRRHFCRHPLRSASKESLPYRAFAIPHCIGTPFAIAIARSSALISKCIDIETRTADAQK